MASPQKENGFTSIANELLEAIFGNNLTQREIKIVLCVIRYTYGFNRKEAQLSLRFISVATNINFRHTQTVLASLFSKNILLIERGNQGINGRIISLNKNYDSWVSIDQKGNTNKPLALTKQVTVALTKTVNSSIDQTGDKEKQKKTLKKEDSYFFGLIPLDLNINGFKETWTNWITYRKEIKKKITVSTAKAQLKKLQDYKEQGMNPEEIINQSIEKGWQGFFPLKQNGESYQQQQRGTLNL